MLAHDLRRVEAFSQGSLILELGEELLSGIRGGLCDSEAQGSEVFYLECLGVVGLAGDGDDLVVLVEVEELELLG